MGLARGRSDIGPGHVSPTSGGGGGGSAMELAAAEDLAAYELAWGWDPNLELTESELERMRQMALLVRWRAGGGVEGGVARFVEGGVEAWVWAALPGRGSRRLSSRLPVRRGYAQGAQVRQRGVAHALRRRFTAGSLPFR